jgi:hypothetical protein
MKELLEIGPVPEHGGGEVAIIGEKHQAAGAVVKRTDGIDTFRKATEKIAERLTAFGIGKRGDNFGRLVHEQINVAALGFHEAAGGFDLVARGIGLGAQFRDDFTVDADLAGKDELLGVATRGNAGVGDDFLEAFEHERKLSVIRKLPRRMMDKDILGCAQNYTGGAARGIGKRWGNWGKGSQGMKRKNYQGDHTVDPEGA